jgi:hypothetical protein
MWELLTTPSPGITALVITIISCTYFLLGRLNEIIDLLKPKRWEYKSFTTYKIKTDHEEHFADDVLGDMDDKGYELVGISPNIKDTLYIFKRPQE